MQGDGEEDEQGDKEGGDSAPLVCPLPSSTTPLYEQGCVHLIRHLILSLLSPLLYYHYLLYYMYYWNSI